jgi:hypothetical protein
MYRADEVLSRLRVQYKNVYTLGTADTGGKERQAQSAENKAPRLRDKGGIASHTIDYAHK